MRILVTGHDGYIGAVLVPLLLSAGHQVTGLDSFLFRGCDFGPEPLPVDVVELDIRDVERQHLAGIDAVIHLAALSNDPLCEINPQSTWQINYEATIRLAEIARAVGVERFIQASTCSLYGASGGELLDETAPIAPVTAYGKAKAQVEVDLALMATDTFSPVCLRNGTAYGRSPRLRTDLVVNNLLGYAHTTGEIQVKSDGTQWRPMIHVEDIARAFLVSLEVPREAVHNQMLNVGSTCENFRVSELAGIIQRVVPGSRTTIGTGLGPDQRTYRVNCDRISREPIGFEPQWTIEAGVKDLHEAFMTYGFTAEDFASSRYFRLRTIVDLMENGFLDENLRRTVLTTN